VGDRLSKLWLIVAALAILVSGGAYAAGLGRLTVHSALGQPLNAEIELVAVKRGETVTARLAPPEVYGQANAQLNPALIGTRITVEKRANGDLYLKASTSRPINEPFIELIVELNSESGRVTRQYTALLDPPGYGRAAGELPPRSETPEPPVAATEPPPQAAPAVPTKETPVRAAPVAPPMDAPPRAAASPKDGPASAASAPGGAGGQYGPIKPGETLGGIARIVKPEGVTLEQTLVALHRHNPDAFIHKNMNLVKSGKILKIPEAGEMTAVTQSEAVREVKLQFGDFNAFRNQLAERAAASAPEEGSATRGRIGSVVTDAAGAEPRDTVRVSRSEPPPGQAPASAKGTADERIRLLEEEAIARQRALSEATERIAHLEKTIRDMQRLAELKTGGAAMLQKAQEPDAAKAAPEAKGAAASTAAGTAVQRVEQTKAGPGTGAPAREPPPPPESARAGTPGVSADASANAPKDASAAPLAALPATAAPSQPAPKPVAAPETSPAFLDSLLDEPLYLGLGAAVVLLGVLGLVAARRRRAAAHPYGDDDYKVAPTLTGRSPVAPVGDGVQSNAIESTAAGTAPTNMPEARISPPAQGNSAQPSSPARSRGAATDNDLDFDLSPSGPTPGARPATAFPGAKLSAAPAEAGSANVAIAATAATAAAAISSIGREPPLQAAPLGTTGIGGGPAETLPSQTAAVTPSPTSPSGASLDADGSGALAETATLKASHLSDFDLETVPPARRALDPATAERASSEPPPRDFEFKLDLDNLDLSAPGEAKPAVAPRDAHWYDVQQKFDLAKAYQEMDNRDGARDILREVLKEGDQEQRTQATQLLAKLG
jgi:pilus assembly protein FimV